MMRLFLTKEIIWYSFVPDLIALLLMIIAFFIWKKKEKYRTVNFNFFIKLMITIMICATLPLITGYTFWVIEMFINKGVLLEHIMYVILIIFLSLGLLALLIWVYLKTLSLVGLIKDYSNEQEDNN